MNYIHEINTQCQRLPEDLQKEVVDFIGYLATRYQLNPINQSQLALSDTELKQATGILKAPKAVSLEEMDRVIKNRGGRL
ncbi:DUF2281 domain-containing protein [Crenothrix polyspora]|uniref:DUF2281 domain-containing protein n=1 Tax=Crenothrix polyspora TaxID=360316 RepID=A0A1R4H0J2_9GAMM|nr:DUF2281 domain-containing protein [Crenothrix polyspora]SJM89725.1 hypothetical protein CRENPOLYSF1_1190007 [Crenothrix polyspora]